MKRFFSLLIFIIIFVSGCSYKVDKPNINIGMDQRNNNIAENKSIIEQDESNIKLDPKVKSIISEYEPQSPQNYVNNMACTNEDINQILEYAKEYGIENPYIPTEGIATDYIMEVRKEDGALQIVYPHFSIHESSKEIPPFNTLLNERSVKLSIGNGIWRDIDGTFQLYLHLDGVYIAIDSAKSFDEKGYEKIAESLVSIKN